jgi:2-polyprenyl-3-methyl-5-hydroxy-6-metoxy-1,4-benzoquinol methylase
MTHSAGDEVCRSCGAGPTRVFYQVERVPIHCCRLIASRREALASPAGALRLAFCDACGFIQNDAFDPALIDYRESYEDSQAFSPRFLTFARGLAERLIATYDLQGHEILEIGCGKGDFLALLCEVGGGRGVGIDPAYRPGRLQTEATGRLEFVSELYSRADRHRRFDLLCCRHTLEHLCEVRDFVLLVGEGMEASPGSVAFFEVPDVTRVLEELAFWDLYYEHCAYFSPGSLVRLFRSCGFEVLRVALGFDDQYILIDARRGDAHSGPRFEEEHDLERLASAVDRFAEQMPPFLADWRKRLARLQSEGRKAVLWGAGSKAVSFLSTLGVASEIEYVVDINPHKWEMHLAGTGHRIVSPTFLKEYAPDLVIAMNPVYEDEIRGDLAAMGLSPEVTAL